LFPAGVAGEILLSLTNQIETLEQRINPIFVPSSLTHWEGPPCFLQILSERTPDLLSAIPKNQGNSSGLAPIPSVSEGPLTI
jgi:hypothetical protein